MTEPLAVDITAPEGRDAVERAVLEALGYRFTRIPETGYPVYERNGQRVPMGWLFTGDGMVEAKRFFVRNHDWQICTFVERDGCVADAWQRIEDEEGIGYE